MPLIHYSASIEDGLRSRRTVAAYLSPANLSAEPAGLAAWLGSLDEVIDGVIVAAKLEVTPTLPTTLLTASRTGFGASRVEQNGEIRFNLSGTSKHWTQAIPAISAGAITGGKVNLTFLATYTTLMLGGTFTEDKGSDRLSTVYGAFLGTRKVRKQLQRSSFQGA